MGTISSRQSAVIAPLSSPALIIVTKKSKSPISNHSSVRSIRSFTINGKAPVRSPKSAVYRLNNKDHTDIALLTPPTWENTSLQDRPCVTDDFVPIPIKPLIVKQRLIAMNSSARDLFIRYLKSGFWLYDLLDDYNESTFAAISKILSRSRSRTSFETISESEDSFFSSQEQQQSGEVEVMANVQELSSMFDKPTLNDLTIALALQFFLESEVYLFMVEEQWSVPLDSVAIVRYHRTCWNPFASLQSKKQSRSECLARQFLKIVDGMDAGMLKTMVGDEEVLYRLHTALEANTKIAYSINVVDDSTSITASNHSSKKKDDSPSIKDKDFRKVYSSPSFDKLKWPRQKPIPMHWITRLQHHETIASTVKMPQGNTVYVQVRAVVVRRAVIVLQPIEEQQPQLAKDLCVILSKLVK